MMDGDIWVESEPNKGSRFSFTARMAVGPNPETAPEPPLAGRNVLLATPSSRQVLVLMRAIGEFGARVQAAKTAAEARGMLKNLDDDPANWVVLADARLPDASGVEFIAQIAGTGAAPAAVLMGPYGDESLKNQAYQAGAKAYLFKPVKTSRLLNGLLQALGIETEAPAEEAPRPPSGHSLAGARLLLVEDNPVNQRVAKEILGQERIQTACAENGRQAVDLIAEQLYDAVLMDIQMPEMDGFEAARAIRDMNQMDQPPIIAMTAHAMQGDRERCLDAGMDDYVAKPINRDELLQTLRKYVAPRPDAPAPEPGESCVSDHAPRMNACGVDASVLDFDEGVERVGGNHAVFLNILADYLRFNNDFGRQLSNLVDQGRLQEAERLAHSLKGAAGNLAAGKLADRARRLEHALGQERIDEIPELLEPVLEAQQEIQAIYDRLQQDVEPPRPPHGTASGEKAGPDHDQALLSQLAESLAQIDPLASLRSLNALKASLAPNGDCADPELSSTLQELEQQVIEYEFDQAVQTLDRMESLLQ
jgi:CheY-like chemotaxis protein/HPt (histidine-containing phosphotransfer) domain-containing protein